MTVLSACTNQPRQAGLECSPHSQAPRGGGAVLAELWKWKARVPHRARNSSAACLPPLPSFEGGRCRHEGRHPGEIPTKLE